MKKGDLQMNTRPIKPLVLVILITIILVILILVFCYLLPSLFGYPGLNAKAKLIVNGDKMKEKCVIYQYGEVYHASIPLLIVIEGLGNQVNIMDDGTLVIINTGKEEFFLRGHKLYEDSELLYEVPGQLSSIVDEKGRPGELNVEREDLLYVLSLIGLSDVSITLDPKGRIVTVTQDR